MNLQEFRSTRVVMSQRQYEAIFGSDNEFTEDTAKVYTYANSGLHIVKLLNGKFYCNYENKYIENDSISIVEFKFWEDFAKGECNPRPILSDKALQLLSDFNKSMIALTQYWLAADDETTGLLNDHYPQNVDSFDELQAELSKWIRETKEHV